MSAFILSIEPFVGLSESPPVSNVTPLPTSTTGFLLTGFFGLCSSTATRGSSTDPRLTASSPPIFSLTIRFLSQISHESPCCLALFWMRSASRRGLFWSGERLTRSRAKHAAWAISAARVAAAWSALVSPSAWTVSASAGPPSSPFSVRCSSNR